MAPLGGLPAEELIALRDARLGMASVPVAAWEELA
jgi:hypothetical protein